MRDVPFTVSDTDAVHVYSDAQHILLQLRRSVPTERDITKASFKVALNLTRTQAIAIARELLTAATRENPPQTGGGKQTPKSKTQ